MWVECFTSNFLSFITPKVYNTEDSNLFYWTKELFMKANDVKIMLRMMRKDNKASVAVQSFPHTNLENTLVCSFLRLVYQSKTTCFFTISIMGDYFFPRSRSKNALNLLLCNLIWLHKHSGLTIADPSSSMQRLWPRDTTSFTWGLFLSGDPYWTYYVLIESTIL